MITLFHEHFIFKNPVSPSPMLFFFDKKNYFNIKMERTIDFRKCLVHLRQEQGLSTPSSEILQNTHTHTTQWYPKALQLVTSSYFPI